MDIIRPTITDGIVITDGKTITVDNVKENGDIIGFTESNVKALYKYDKNKWFFGSDIGKCNLISLRDRTEKERKEISDKAREKARENRENKKNFNELARAMLEQTLTTEQVKQIFGDNPNILLDNSVGSCILGSMIKGALDGSFKCAEFVRDTAGFKPKNEVELQADIMTESDKALIEKLQKRIG